MNRNFGLIRRIAFVFALALAGAAGGLFMAAATADSAFAQQIEVRGNQRIDADTIRSYFRTAPGQPLDAVRIDEGLKALLATGLYADVNISRPGGRLVVTVVENQTINRVAFEGNKKVNDEALTAEVQSKPRGALSRPTVQSDVQRIIDVYRRQGHFNTRVTPQIIDLPNNRVDLVFEVDDGARTTVKKIVFVGNEEFSSWKLLDVINTGTTNWFSFLGTKDVYDPDRVSADQELLRRHYLKNGYADFRILSATVDLDSQLDGFVITFTLDEGQRYRFGNIDIISNIRDADPDALRRILHTKSGSVYNADQVEKSVEDLTIELAKLGYAFAQVRPRGDRDFEGRLINVTYVLEEGARVYVERINIRGNTRTRDWVIRREFDILEGDAYNRVMVDRAERRIRNLGYFSDVKITNEPGSAPDRIVLNVTVTEQLTGEFSVGGGYSTADGFIGEVSIAERNFLGRGQFVRLAGSFGQYATGGEFSFTEPYFMGTRVAAGFDIFHRTARRSAYNPVDNQSTGGTLRLGLPLTEETTLGLRYSLFQRKIDIAEGLKDLCRPGIDSTGGTNPPPNCYDDGVQWVVGGVNTGEPGDPREVSAAYVQQEGSRITSLFGYSLVYNSLDDIRNPTSGTYAVLSQDFAGAGGDAKYVKTTAEARTYYPITGELTGMLKAQGGHIFGWGKEDLLVFDHFFQGPSLVRGFEPSGIGPRDLLSPNQDAIGGTSYWGVSAELIFPFPLTPKDFGLKAAVFADAGSLWGYDGATTFTKDDVTYNIVPEDSNKIRSSVGVSLIWQSPFGPLRFDYAHVLTKATGDKTQAFRFGAGGKF